MKVSEIADYLQNIEDCNNKELNDIEDGADDEMGVLPVSDVAGQVEFSCTIDNVEEDHPISTTSRTSKTVT